MNSIKQLFFIATSISLSLNAHFASAQAVAKPASAPVSSVSEPMGDAYKVPKALPSGVARLTVYRPAVGFGVGAANLEINSQYHLIALGRIYPSLF